MTVLTIENPVKQQQELENIINSLVLAFSADPVTRWMYPSDEQYFSSFPDFVKSFGANAFDCKTVYYPDNFAGAALWFPPQVEPDTDLVVEMIQRTISPENIEQVFNLFEQMSHFHPTEPHWYLGILGVKSTQRKKGYGSALIKQILSICDRHNQLAYLEASSLANVSFYKKYGFEVIRKIQVDKSPSMFAMIRYPRNV